MNDLHARALALFDDYADLPPAELARRLHALARQDPPLHDVLQTLLAADREQPGKALLGRSPAELIQQWQQTVDDERVGTHSDEDPRLGTRLGPWRISDVIAHGGMGTVYAAERDDGQYRQRVALKCMRLELDTPALDAAFRRERDLLAQLDHPGIAGLIDGGLDDSGRPWFAMRLVDGSPIDAWCDARRLDVRARVDLLLHACDAMAYAHAHGVVHGDIKPGNLLVGTDGRTQLVDFGISSVRDAADGRLGVTPDYAAPEHLRLGTPSAATDLYAFGVLMYRLLCGQWPTPRHLLRAVLPETKAEAVPMELLLTQVPADTAALRGADDNAALSRQLSGDLSAIARKAVATDPTGRYASIAALAEDLRRWREHRVVTAYPVGLVGRSRRWLRRNRLAATASAVLFAALGMATTLAVLQREHASREAGANAIVSRLFASTLGTATLSGLGTTPYSSRGLLDRMQRELRSLALDRHPALRAESLAIIARGYAVIGDYRQAERLADEARATLGDEADRNGLVAATHVAMLNNQGRYAQAEREAAKARARLPSGSEPARLARLAFGAELAKAQWGLGRTLAALATADRLLADARRLGPTRAETTAELLIMRSEFKHRLLLFLDAETDAKEAIALTHSVNPVLADDALEVLTNILYTNNVSASIPHAERLLQGRLRTLGHRHPKTSRAVIRVALAQYPRLPREDIVRALARIEASYGRKNPNYASALSMSAWAIAHDPRDNIRLLREALAIQERTLRPLAERRIVAKSNLGKDLLTLPMPHRHPEDVSEGIRLLSESIQEKHASGLPATREQLNLAASIISGGDARLLSDAEIMLRASGMDVRRYYPRDGDMAWAVFIQESRLLFLKGRREEADRRFARYIDANRVLLGSDQRKRHAYWYGRGTYLVTALVYRALHAHETCRRKQAEGYLLQAIEFGNGFLNSGDPHLRTARDYLDSLRKRRRMLKSDDMNTLAKPENDAVNARAARCAASGAG